MKILLTGATGFLGSHLLDVLLENHYQVVILKRSFSDTWRINHLLHKVKSHDVDKEPLEKSFQENNINVVIHTATHYGRNNDLASKVAETNTLFPLRLLETAIFFDTVTFFNADTLLHQCLNNYALSKKHFVQWLKLFSHAGRIRVVNLKIEHMYGPKDDKRKFVTWVLRQMITGTGKIPLTEGEQKRDFVYISDVVNAFLLVLQKQDNFSPFTEFDVGTGRAISIKAFILKLKGIVGKALGKDISAFLDFGALPYRQGEPMEIAADISKLIELGWNPKIPVDVGLQELVREELS